jgi:hypothetical protein
MSAAYFNRASLYPIVALAALLVAWLVERVT